MSQKLYKAIVRKEVTMTKNEYRDHLKMQQAMYNRLMKDEDQKLEDAKKRWHKKTDEYHDQINKIDAQIKELK